MTKDKKEWECLGGAIYSVLHEAALKVVILDNGLISKVDRNILPIQTFNIFSLSVKSSFVIYISPIYNCAIKVIFIFPFQLFVKEKESCSNKMDFISRMCFKE